MNRHYAHPQQTEPEFDDFDIDDRPSKSQRKRDSQAQQALGERLVTLPAGQLARLDLPERLLQAVIEARKITSHGARRRQMQFIGKLMRAADETPILALFAEIDGDSATATARLHRIEHLRDRFMEDEQVASEIAETHPGADLTRLRQLRRNAIRERDQNKPPRQYRELFQALKNLPDTPADPSEPARDNND